MKKFLTVILASFLFLISFGAIACAEQPKDKVGLKYYQDGSQIVPLILGGAETIGLIPEPAASALQKNATAQGKTLYRLDLQELYDADEKAYPQAVLMVKKSVIATHNGLISTLEQKITESVSWAKQNVQNAVNAIGEHGATTLKAGALNQNVIDACKIYWQSAVDAKTSVKNYVEKIIGIDSASAKAVSDDFFYTSASGESQKAEYTFVAPDGAPAIAISKLLYDEDGLSTGKKVNYGVVAAGQIKTSLTNGSADFVLAPVNLASKFYKEHNQTDHYVMVAVITHGNFYIISSEQITINDLSGKQMAVPMKGAVPDWTLQIVLNKYNLPYQTIE